MFEAIDLAYAAGIVDGEGCIMAKPDRRHVHGTNYQLTCKIEMAELETILWFQAKFGGGINKPKRSRSYFRQTYRWEICGKRCLEFLARIEPYMKGKKAQALVALSWPYTRNHQKEGSEIRLKRDYIYRELQRLKRELSA